MGRLGPPFKHKNEAAMTEQELKTELERAYRCIRGFYSANVRGKTLDDTPLAYHSPTIAAAIRFVDEGALDGSEYFIGKNVDVMHDVFRNAQPKD